MRLENIKHLIDAVDDWVEGRGNLFQIAWALEEPVGKLEVLFQMTGLKVVDGYGRAEATTERVMMVLLTYYCLKDEKHFTIPGFTKPLTKRY
jgi:hypothetical protein